MTKQDLKNNQRVLAWVTIVDAQDDMPGRHFIECAIHNDLRVCFPRTDIIDPADPSLGPWAGWEESARSTETAYEHVVIRRPITPLWKPKEGEPATYKDKRVTVKFIAQTCSVIRSETGGRDLCADSRTHRPAKRGVVMTDRDELTKIVDAALAKIEALRTENARLREALQEIADGKFVGMVLPILPPKDAARHVAQKALREGAKP